MGDLFGAMKDFAERTEREVVKIVQYAEYSEMVDPIGSSDLLVSMAQFVRRDYGEHATERTGGDWWTLYWKAHKK